MPFRKCAVVILYFSLDFASEEKVVRVHCKNGGSIDLVFCSSCNIESCYLQLHQRREEPSETDIHELLCPASNEYSKRRNLTIYPELRVEIAYLFPRVISGIFVSLHFGPLNDSINFIGILLYRNLF